MQIQISSQNKSLSFSPGSYTLKVSDLFTDVTLPNTNLFSITISDSSFLFLPFRSCYHKTESTSILLKKGISKLFTNSNETTISFRKNIQIQIKYNRQNSITDEEQAILDFLDESEAKQKKATVICEICYENITTNASYDVCKHEFCLNCSLQWAASKDFCPMCKQKVSYVRWFEGNSEKRRYIYELEEDDFEICLVCEDRLDEVDRIECVMCYFPGHSECLMVDNYEIPFYCLDCIGKGIKNRSRRGCFEATAVKYKRLNGI